MREINFIGRKKIWFALSAIMICIGIASLVLQGLNFGIDFTGGTLIDLKTDKVISVKDVRTKVLEPLKLTDNKIQLAGEDGKEVIIRVGAIDEVKRQNLLNAFGQVYGKYEVMKIEKVSPVIGKELIWQAVFALLIASVLMIIYLAVRFEYRFAISGIIGILHDIAIVITFTSLFQIQVDSGFVAIILTVVGYSINDTIVVFDRIRENLGQMQKGENYDHVANRSINQTLARCINTTGTTLAALLAIWIFGGATIQGFVFGLFVGIATGAYSSIFLCCPIWSSWKQHDADIMHATGGKGKKKLAKA